ncbi:MAG: hypothetical protein IAE82_10725 [Opitutaceae bacterium]|nr:hypothetical protein [Opitutaceae bacterium]
MESLLLALGGTSTRYTVVAVLAGLALLGAAWSPRRVKPLGYLAALGLFLLACRWPLAALNVELGVDDSQALAGAMRLSTHPIPWKYVDLNTVGPLNMLPVVLMSWIGIPIQFSTSHFAAVLMLWIALGGAYLMLREEADERVARCGVLPAVVFFALTTFFDFAYSTSEHVPMALIGAGSALLWQGAHRGVGWRVLLGMAALGATPWAKLQTVPLALWFCLAGGVVIVWRWRTERSRLWRLLGAWLGGGVLVSVLFGAMILIWGLGRQWYLAYIQQAFNYKAMGGLTFSGFWRAVPEFTKDISEVHTYTVPLLVIGLMLVGAAVFVVPRRWVTLGVLLVAAFVAAYVVAAPGRLFFHYLLLGVIPLCMVVAALLDAVLDRVASARSCWYVHGVLAVLLAATLVPQVRSRMSRDHPGVPYQRGHIALHVSDPARVLADAARPGDTMTIWGWASRLHVESGLPQATRDGTTERQIVGNPLLDFYRTRYLFDLRRHQPRFFVEAVGPEFFAYQDRARDGFETWPELREYVAAHYELMREVGSCRIFVRKSGAAEMAVSP